MARISGVDIPREKRVDVSLRYIFGIGATTARQVLDEAKIDHAVRVRDLTEAQIAKIRAIIDRAHTVEGDLRRQVALNVKRLQEARPYPRLRPRPAPQTPGPPPPTTARPPPLAHPAAACHHNPPGSQGETTRASSAASPVPVCGMLSSSGASPRVSVSQSG